MIPLLQFSNYHSHAFGSPTSIIKLLKSNCAFDSPTVRIALRELYPAPLLLFSHFGNHFPVPLVQWFSNLSEVSNPTGVMQAYIEPLIITRSRSRKF